MKILDSYGGSTTGILEPVFRFRMMVIEEEFVSRTTIFDGSDFLFWGIQIEDYMCSMKLHFGGIKEDEWNLLDRHVLG